MRGLKKENHAKKKVDKMANKIGALEVRVQTLTDKDNDCMNV